MQTLTTPSFKEDHISQIPALQLLQNIGYLYLSPTEVMRQRRGKNSNIVLEDILEAQLRKLNQINFRGKLYAFSDTNIRAAIEAIRDTSLVDGLIKASERMYELITLGKSFEQIIEGDRKSYSLRYFDWEHPENNVYHITEEFEVAREGNQSTYRPDVILYVNGIPLVVIECKRPDLKESLQEAVSQHLRNQHTDGIPKLYIYAQLLISINVNEGKYAATGTASKFWAVWKEQYGSEDTRIEDEANLFKLKNTPLGKAQKDLLFSERYAYVKRYFEEKEKETILPTYQDKLLYYLCRPERLMEIIFQFIIYDAGEKKIARYQQYFAVKHTLNRVKHFEGGRRLGGIIWHTQGSGKSLTMVMMAKALALDKAILNPRVVLVTDRIDLDDQIYNTFKSCRKEVVQAKTGKNLLELVSSDRDAIITTIINKFEAAMKGGDFFNESENIFVLVDESHRGQYGSANIRMQKVLPKACYIGFTGTPLLKKEKNTARKFGGIIDKYTIDQAVDDGAVVPLLYEGRHVVQEVNEKPIDRYFDLISEPLSEYQKADLKKKFTRADQLNEADQKIHRVCWDISLHFRNEWQGTPFKAQLTVPSKAAAIKYKNYLDEIGYVTSEVIISTPDSREGYDNAFDAANDKVQAFWKKMMDKYGNEKAYNDSIINGFKYGDSPETIIVVDKLLTGFDAPRNAVLYVARTLKEHTLLQAIARVNRIFEGKDFGYIIDYCGILGNLDEALTNYSSLSEFAEEDLIGTIANVEEEVKKLPERHAHVWDIFKEIKNRRDEEAYEQLLANEDLREQFYNRLSLFARTLKIALSTLSFIQNTPEADVEKFRTDAKFFLKLRVSVQQRYSDSIDYRQYETQIQKLIDTHITSDEIIQITQPINIFEREKFQEEVERVEGKAAKADTIASRTARTITEKMDEDPAFYRKFSELLEEAIQTYRDRRISDAEYLNRVTDIMDAVRDRKGDDIPEKLHHHEVAKAFYGIVLEFLNGHTNGNGTDTKEVAADAGLQIDTIIRSMKIVDWHRNEDIKNRMRLALDDYLFELKDQYHLTLDTQELFQIVEKSLAIAERRY